VLVVDDEPAIRDSLAAFLGHLGIVQVHTAGDGKIALETLAREHFDYVFMDLNMPEMGGMEVLQNLGEGKRPTSIIVMTGYPSMEKVIEVMHHGASDFLVKPFRLHDVKVSLERVHRYHLLAKKNWILRQELEQKKEVEKLNKDLQERIQEKTLLYNIVDSLSKITRSDELYGYLVNKAVESCQAEKACFLIFDPGRSSLLTFTQHGVRGLKPGLRVALEGPPGGRGSLEGDFVETYFSKENGNRVFVDRPTVQGDLICIPVHIREEPFGVLLVSGRKGRCGFTGEDEFILKFLAERVALNVENMALYDNLKENLLATLGALVNAIEARDSYTQQHSERVTQFAIAIAQALGHSREDLRKIESAGVLHDIGKIGIDDSILKKPGKLTREEFERIKAHPLIGVNIVLSLGLHSDEMTIIRNHHERWDGRGYPDGLRGEEIPILARILAVADAFDAMNSSRAYRRALPFPECLRELRENSGSQFDPHVVEAALSILSP
jgi:putative nucleotidyltransferase with HDIG domain